ncbi:hypothetical protein AVEN_190074-1 [Araneus ventricosus]|uniref:Uncharacterized protein n=1 Tax=Araneus ventricosus TaxID=182803 RepID=A0A4Y2JUE1_ARAVE|nr:hypothetical protein AVEN_190074-1 [Araneus ventricosus]
MKFGIGSCDQHERSVPNFGPIRERVDRLSVYIFGHDDSKTQRFRQMKFGPGPFPSYLYRFRIHHSDICACGEKGDPLHYATSCHMTSSYHFTKPSAENTELWWKSVLSNKLSRINIAKLVSFLNEIENLIKQPPDATSSSDSDPDLSPSPRPQTHGLRPSRGSIPRTLVSPPTSI